MATEKDTIYIDIDDEITGIIDKVRGSDGKVVALVLPKRASVFQSIVNMKLLKRAAEASKKHIVLITTEAGLLPLAGAAGVHVAKTLTSKPEVPLGPDGMNDLEEMVDEPEEEIEPEITTETDGDKPIGELAGVGAGAAAADEVETLELDDEPDAPEGDKTVAATAAAAAAKPPKDSKLKVPDFNRFRLWLILGGAIFILLIVFLFLAIKVLPKATITISTNASNVNSGMNVNLSTTAKTLDEEEGVVPAKRVTQQKTYTQQASATGQKNNGSKAAGSVTISLSNCNYDTITLPAGTGVSANSQTYITQSSITLSSVKVGGNCNPNSFSNIYSQSVNVVAASGGSAANISSGTTMSVSPPSSCGCKVSDFKASSGAISGGTDDIVKVVSQSDIDGAKSKINTEDSAVKQTLKNQLEDDQYYAIMATYNSGTPTYTNSASAGDAVNNVTVTAVVTYSMFGAHEDDLKALIKNDIKDQVDIEKQGILSYGLEDATFNVDTATDKDAALAMQVTATVGPNLDIAGIKKEAAGKKAGAVKDALKTNPDVTDVKVKTSPFWVSSVPKKESKITVTIEKPKSAPEKSSASD